MLISSGHATSLVLVFQVTLLEENGTFFTVFG